MAGPGPRKGRKLQALSFTRLIPNIATLAGLCAGLTGVRFAVQDRWEAAVAAIIIAAVLDGIDGRLARLLKATSRFGAELDSLSDFICFGVAPALILWMWVGHDLGPLGWAASLVYAVCCVLRLARFNTEVLGEPELPSWASRYFTGVPAPAGAGLVLLPMAITFEFGSGVVDHPLFVAFWMAAVGALMVSRVPTFSFKKVKVPKMAAMPLLFGVVLITAFLVSNTWLTLAAVGVLYLLTFPFSIRSYLRVVKTAEPEG